MQIQKISFISLFVALSIVGAYIKIPSPVGSVALDVFPALVAVILIGRKSGATVAFLGHMISALLGGMPLGPFHFLIAVEMALIVWLFGYLYHYSRLGSTLVFVFLNGLVASAPFIFVMSLEFYLALTPSLLIAATVNGLIAVILIPRIESIFKSRMVHHL